MNIQHYIDGRMVASVGGDVLENIEPATGLVSGTIADGDERDVALAVEAGERAFSGWAGMSGLARGSILTKLADLIDRDVERLARAESLDSGKPVSVARSVDIPRSAANIRYFAGAALHQAGELHDFDGAGTPGGVKAINITLRSPRGVAGCISPWNLPLYLLTWKIAPALATGNTVVAKPSEVTPLTAMLLCELAEEAGVPRGVLNVVHGRGDRAGAALVKHERVPAITFTGSTGVGKWIGAECGARLKRVSLELGGKNPFVIFDDANLEGAIATAARAAFSNQGQICLCGSRLLVQRGVAKQVIEGVVAAAKRLVIGDPMEEKTQFGALVSEAHLKKVAARVEMARGLGARVLCGGERVMAGALPERCRGGYFYTPTVLEGLDPMCEVEQEEIFGPVVSVQVFDDEAQAVELANSTPYGLAATIFTQDVSRAQRMMRAVEAGIVWINCWMVRDLRTPFGGVKQSGVGREGGLEALKFFTESKNVTLA